MGLLLMTDRPHGLPANEDFLDPSHADFAQRYIATVSYSRYNAWRLEVAAVTGFSDVYAGGLRGRRARRTCPPELVTLLLSPDNEGEWTTAECDQVLTALNTYRRMARMTGRDIAPLTFWIYEACYAMVQRGGVLVRS